MFDYSIICFALTGLFLMLTCFRRDAWYSITQWKCFKNTDNSNNISHGNGMDHDDDTNYVSREKKRMMIQKCLVVTAYHTLQKEGDDDGTNTIKSANTNGVKRDTDLDHSCCICLNEYKAQDKVSQGMSCNHVFHWKCLTRWLECHDDCPICRSSMLLTTSSMDYVLQNV